MATPSLFALGASATGTAASVTFAWPAGHASNDVAVLVLEMSGSDAALTPPSGWENVTASIVDVASTAGSRLQVMWRRATSDAEASVAFTAVDHLVGRIAVFRGCRAIGSPFSVSATSLKTTASTAVTFPAVTTTEIDCLVLFVATRANDAATLAYFSVATNSALTNIAEIFEIGTASGNGGGAVLGSGRKAAAGSTGTTSSTCTVSTTNACMTMALLPFEDPAASNTNALIDSEVFASNWDDGMTPIVAADVSADPNGVNSVDELTTNFSGSQWVRQTKASGLTAGSTYTFSCWMQQGRSGSATHMRLTTNNNAAWSTGSSTKYALTSELVRCSTTWVQTGTTNGCALIIGAVDVAGGGDSSCLGNVRIWGAMLNSGASPGVYSRSPAHANALAASIALTEPSADAVNSDGSITLKVTSAAAESAVDKAAAAGVMPVVGLALTSEAGDAGAAAASIQLGGTIAPSETGDAAAGGVDLEVSASIALAESDEDVVSALGGLEEVGGGSANLTESDVDAASGAGAFIVAGVAGAPDAQDAANVVGGVILSGTGAAPEPGGDAAEAVGVMPVAGSIVLPDDSGDVALARAYVLLTGSASGNEPDDALAAAGSIVLAGQTAATEAGEDLGAATGSMYGGGMVIAFDKPDTAAGAGAIVINGYATLTEPRQDGVQTIGWLEIMGSASGQEPVDGAHLDGSIYVGGSAGLTELDADVCSASGQTPMVGIVFGTEDGDDAHAYVYLFASLPLPAAGSLAGRKKTQSARRNTQQSAARVPYEAGRRLNRQTSRR